jgi:hypothetical protein
VDDPGVAVSIIAVRGNILAAGVAGLKGSMRFLRNYLYYRSAKFLQLRQDFFATEGTEKTI